MRRLETEKRKAAEKIQKEKIAAEKKERLEQKAALEAELFKLKEQEALEEVMEILEPDALETLGIDPQGEINEPETEKADNDKDEP